MTILADFRRAFEACSLVAILRGVRPDEIDAIGDVLVDSGFTLIEVPLNSPDPLRSIETLAKRIGDRALVGAGTVLAPGQVDSVRNAGGGLIVSPNTNVEVIAKTVQDGLVSLPGFQTASEAFAAIDAGAHALKLFPAEAASPRVLKALRAVVPAAMPVLAVGGITPETMHTWTAAGATGFGLGSALYSAGIDAATVRANALAFLTALRAGA
ncbi:2-dehydro-3-deoxy-6-phosphogalactonate aldolase [Sphingomonas cavernae]|uniref:2-dehydro-3-deoxy-6-phosphogalactonate aldolase n=1 Tax=Sphingomonas cavernae TaxID=2320861 RepID=A0A418WKV2_9SPHN|nr:2-dehydro-3-deoxy-6-phosphogalactonate aldolase [Sphingomonas cavernae]RJF90635.1 2-dehydro-3-deoxy-6-phosphogalactonate aldolase [Sphingomonas cavernae]